MQTLVSRRLLTLAIAAALSGCAADRHGTAGHPAKPASKPTSVPTTQPSHAQTVIDLQFVKLTGHPNVMYGYGFDPNEKAFSIPFPNQSKSLRFKNDQGKLLVDTNGDGKITQADGPARKLEKEVIEVDATIAGRPVKYPFHIEGVQQSGDSSYLQFAPYAALEGQYHGHTIQILGDLYGQIANRGGYMRVLDSSAGRDASPAMVPWSTVIELDGSLCLLELRAGGWQLAISPYTGPVADVTAKLPESVQSGQVTLTSVDGRMTSRVEFGVTRHLIPGRYRVKDVVMMRTSGNSQTYVMADQPDDSGSTGISAGPNTVILGKPVKLELVAAFDGQTLNIGNVLTTGVAGERYRLMSSDKDTLTAFIRSGGKEEKLAKLEYG